MNECLYRDMCHYVDMDSEEDLQESVPSFQHVSPRDA